MKLTKKKIIGYVYAPKDLFNYSEEVVKKQIKLKRRLSERERNKILRRIRR